MSSPDLIILQVVEADPAEEKRIIEDIHSYASKGAPGTGPGLETPIRPTGANQETRQTKRRTPRSYAEDLPLIEVQNNIIQVLAEKINQRSDQIEKMIQSNSAELDHVREALNSVHRHVLNLNQDNKKLRSENMALRQKMSEMDSRVEKQEKFSRGFSLQLHGGVAENSSEKVQEVLREVCSALDPEEKKSHMAPAVDNTPLTAGEDPQPITSRDLAWKHAKQSAVLQDQGFAIQEDLSVGDKAGGSCLWSTLETVRQEDLLSPAVSKEVPADQEKPDPPQIQEESEGLCPSPEGGQLVLNQEADPFSVNDKEGNGRKSELQNPPASENPDQDRTAGHLCGRECPDNESLLVHMRQDAGDKQYLCFTCGKRFVSRSGLCKHKRIHTGEKPFICEHCGKGFLEKHSLLIHMRIHTGERPFSCETCGKTFVRRENLTIHKTIHSDQRLYTCEFCGKTFKRVDVLGFHRRIHTGEKLYSCELCGNKFTQGSALRVHRRTHTGEIHRRDNRYPCKICGKRFTQKAYVSVHMRIHTGDNLYPCKMCGKRFSQKDYVLIHMRSHTGEKPYFCQICGSRFTQKGSLTRHLETHGGPDQYSCETCGKSFGHRGSLNLHLRTHKEEK